jgi:hypothetical protein
MGTGDGGSADPNELKKQQDLRRVVTALAITTAAGLIGIFISTGWSCAVALLWAGACLVTGALVGFLFGIPKEVQGDAKPASAATVAQASAQPSAAYEQRVNTNLEQVSDWLTKIIVGLGLVELRNIPDHLQSIAAFLARSYDSKQCPAFGNCPAFGGAVTVYFAVVGFFGGYLLTRLFLAPAFSALGLSQLANVAIGGNRLLRQEGIEPPQVQRTMAAIRHVDDPQKGRWGGRSEANGRRLTAKVTPAPGTPAWFLVHLEVTSLDPVNQPLTGNVIFHLHPTFDPPDRTVAAVDNKAVLDIYAYGAFTVGAEADNGSTRLELDLAELPDAPPEFRSR